MNNSCDSVLRTSHEHSNGRLFFPVRMILMFAFLFSGLATVATGQGDPNGLTIHPDNPNFLFYKGRFIVSWANNSHGINPATLAQFKVTHYELEHRWVDGIASSLSGNRFPRDGNIVFNDSYFSDLKSELRAAADKGVAVSIVLFSLTSLEEDRTPGSRFGQNAWNACLGGPISIGSCPFQQNGSSSSGATRQFLTLEDYDYSRPLTEQYSSYDTTWPLARQVQYRTEEIIKKFVLELKDLDNWFFNMLWEIDDNPSDRLTKEWAAWFGGFVHHFDSRRLVCTGEEAGAEYATSASTVNGSCHEGNLLGSDLSSSVRKLANLGNTGNSKPKIIIGYDPFDRNGARRDKLFATNPKEFDSDKNIEYMRAALIAGNGVHPGTPFHSIFYDMSKVLRWVKALQDFLETVDSWHNEPGDEINDSTLPRADDFSFIDLPDGDGKVGWPRNKSTTPDVPPLSPKNVRVSGN